LEEGYAFVDLWSQGNEDADVLATEGSSSLFLSPKPAISVSPCVGRLRVKEWLKDRHSKHWTPAPSMRQLTLFTERPSDKLHLGQETMQAGNRVVN
jgi:hypothetical protein